MTVFELSHINFIASLGENCIALGSFVTCVTPIPGSRSPRGGYGMTESTTIRSSENWKPLLFCSGGVLLGVRGLVCSRKSRFTITASRSFNSQRSHVTEKLCRERQKVTQLFRLEMSRLSVSCGCSSSGGAFAVCVRPWLHPLGVQ